MSEDIRTEILKRSSDLFYKFGIKSVSIDDICREVGISKKTFYVYYTTKDELVANLLRTNHECMHRKQEEYMASHSLIDIARKVTNLKTNDDLRRIPQLVYDLQKYYSHEFENYQRIVFNDLKNLLCTYIKKGVDEHIFREDIDIEATSFLLAKLHTDVMRDASMLEANNIPIARLMRNSTTLLIRGMLTEQSLHEIFGKNEE